MKLKALLICIVLALPAIQSASSSVEDPDESLQGLRNSSEALDDIIVEASGSKRLAFKSAKRQVDRTISSGEKLQKVLNDATEEVDNNVKDELEDVAENIIQWISTESEKTSTLNQTQADQVEEIITELTNKYSSQISSCAVELGSGLTSYATRVQKSLQNSNEKSQRLVQRVVSCANSSSRTCTRNVRDEKKKLHDASANFTRLRIEGQKIARKGVTSTSCKRNILSGLKTDQAKASSEIDDIVESSQA